MVLVLVVVDHRGRFRCQCFGRRGGKTGSIKSPGRCGGKEASLLLSVVAEAMGLGWNRVGLSAAHCPSFACRRIMPRVRLSFHGVADFHADEMPCCMPTLCFSRHGQLRADEMICYMPTLRVSRHARLHADDETLRCCVVGHILSYTVRNNFWTPLQLCGQRIVECFSFPSPPIVFFLSVELI